MEKKEKTYIENSLVKIQAFIAGTCIGANLVGLEGREWHYDMGETGRRVIEKEVMKLYRYGRRIK